MSKRYMPSLDALDAGESPVLGIRDREDLADLESEDYLIPGDAPAPGYLDDLFDAYE